MSAAASVLSVQLRQSVSAADHLADKTVHCRSEPLSSMRRSQYGAIDQLTAAKSRPQRYTVCYPTPKADNFQLRRPTGDKDLCETGARMTGSA